MPEKFQVINSLFSREMDNGFYRELSVAVTEEYLRLHKRPSFWNRLKVNFNRLIAGQIHGMRWFALLLPVLAVTMIVIFIKRSSEFQGMTLDELDDTITFGPTFILVMGCFLLGIQPLSSHRGKRNAFFPAWDDTLGRWVVTATIRLFLLFFVISLLGLFFYIRPVVELSDITIWGYSLLNAALLTSIAVILIRLCPPSFGVGFVGAVPAVIISFAIYQLGAEFFGNTATEYVTKNLNLPASVMHLWWNIHIEKNGNATALLFSIISTIFIGGVSFWQILNRQPIKNFVESKVERKLDEQRNREWLERQLAKLGTFLFRGRCHSKTDQRPESRIRERIDELASPPSSYWQRFLVVWLGEYRWRLSAISQIVDPTLKSRENGLLSVLGFTLLLIVALLSLQLNPLIMALAEAGLLACCVLSTQARLNGGACPARYPLSYWSGVFATAKFTLAKMAAVIPIYGIYLILLSSLASVPFDEIGLRIVIVMAVCSWLSGFSLVVGYPIYSKTISLILLCFIGVLGVMIALSPAILALHYQLENVIQKTPQDVLDQNLGVAASLGNPWADVVWIAIIIGLGVTYFPFYSIVAHIQKDCTIPARNWLNEER